MKLLLSCVALFALSGSRAEKVALTFAPEEGTTLTRTFDAEAEYHLSERRLSLDGEEQDLPAELPDYSEGFDEHIAVTDQLKSVADGRPGELVRTFDELGQTSHASQGDEEMKVELESALQGRAVRFTWDGEGAYTVAAEDEEVLEDEVAADLMEDMDLRLVLPAQEVEAGDEWALDPKLYLAFMWPSGLVGFHAEDEEPSEVGRQGSRQTIEHLEGTGTARLEELREEDGVHIAVIHVELEITTGSEHTVEAVEQGEEAHPAITFEAEIEREVSGTIQWDLDHGHALSAELAGKASRLDSRTWKALDEEGKEIEVEAAELYEGTIRYSATIERR